MNCKYNQTNELKFIGEKLKFIGQTFLFFSYIKSQKHECTLKKNYLTTLLKCFD